MLTLPTVVEAERAAQVLDHPVHRPTARPAPWAVPVTAARTPAPPVPRTTSQRDLGLLARRALRRDSRMFDTMVIHVALPVAIMVTFVYVYVYVYVFGGAIDTGAGGLPYIDFVVPAVMLMSATGRRRRQPPSTRT